jgi:hypothetical protein
MVISIAMTAMLAARFLPVGAYLSKYDRWFPSLHDLAHKYVTGVHGQTVILKNALNVCDGISWVSRLVDWFHDLLTILRTIAPSQ